MASVTHSNLFQIHAGVLPTDACVAIVRTEWNAVVVDELEAGCKKTLLQFGCKNINSIVVPGVFELPFGIKAYWQAHQQAPLKPSAIIALGCVIQGDTPHFNYVCKAVTEGVLQLNLQLPIPVIFGVLTVNNPQQAKERLGGQHGHKGEEAAITAIKMIALAASFYP
jgi:6,7-dimethyl-8-ribityllumazine synthase